MKSSSPPAPPTPPGRSGVVVPRKLSWGGHVVAGFLHLLIGSLKATLRLRIEDPQGLLSRPEEAPVIFSIWHNRLSLSMSMWNVFREHFPGIGLAALISASKDGALLARSLERFHIQPVRGSSSRRGAQALRELTSWVERGYCVAITPDGPRGPKYSVQEGIIALARLTGRPIVPVGVEISSKWQLKSWDRFQIPYPFAQCRLRVGKLMFIPRELTDAQRQEATAELRRVMMEINSD